MSLGEGPRGTLARLRLTIVEELDLTPWRGPESRTRDLRGVRWVVVDEVGRRGFLVVGLDGPTLDTAVGAHGWTDSSVNDFSSLREVVEATSLFRLPGTDVPTPSWNLESLLESRRDARPFVSNDDVVDLYARLGDRRLALSSAVAVSGGDRRLARVVRRPENADPVEYERVRGLAEDLDAGASVEWTVRRLGDGSTS